MELRHKQEIRVGDCIIIRLPNGELQRGIVLQRIAKVTEVYCCEVGIFTYPLEDDIYGNCMPLTSKE